MNPTPTEQYVPAGLAVFAMLGLMGQHWLQMPDQAMTALVGVLAGACTLFFVNKHRTTD